MAKNSVADWDATAANNTDVGGIDVNEGCPAANINNAIREVMAQTKTYSQTVPALASVNAYTKIQKWAKGADVASAATLTLGDDGNYFDVTGTTAITSIATKGVGTRVLLQFDAALTLTHHATDLKLPTGANITTSAGDHFEFLEYASGDWRCVGYSLANGRSLAQPAPVSGEFLRGYINGLVLSNNATDATNDIDIATGSAGSDGTTPFLMTLSSALTKRLDASWSVGTGNGGLDTGTIANTTYHIWLIQRSDTGVVDALFSTSATSPTMPSNYDRKRRIGSIIRESGAIRAFSQLGDEFLWLNPDLSWNVTNPGTSTVNRTVKVPSGFAFRAMLNILLFDTGSLATTTAALVTSISQNDTAATATNFSIVAVIGSSTSDPYGASSYLEVRTDNLARVRTNVSASGSATTFRCMTMGYIDERGRT